MKRTERTERDPQQAFADAIKSGRLSTSHASPVFAGKYMFMGNWDGEDTFKNIDSRKYLSVRS